MKYESANISSKYNFINSQKNISEARESISLKYNHRRAQKDISEALEQLPSSKDLSETHRVSSSIVFSPKTSITQNSTKPREIR